MNHIEKVLQIVERYEQIPIEIVTREEILVEIPHILEKIVEKIVVMPQIVEVLRYVHEVCQEETPGVALGEEEAEKQQQYRKISASLKAELDRMLKALPGFPGSQQQIQAVEKLLTELNRHIMFPKLVKVVEEKVVEKEVEKIVALPTQDDRSLHMELSLSLLVEKLISELRRIRNLTGQELQLEEEIKLLFLAEIGEDCLPDAAAFKEYARTVERSFGAWGQDHQLMLNSFLQERFLMAQLIQDAREAEEKAGRTVAEVEEALRQAENKQGLLMQLLEAIERMHAEQRLGEAELQAVLREFRNFRGGQRVYGRILESLTLNSSRYESCLREKENEIEALKRMVKSQQHGKQATLDREALLAEIRTLRSSNLELQTKVSELALLDSYKRQIQDLHQANLQLESTISEYRSQIYNLENELRLSGQLSFRKDSLFKKELSSRENMFDETKEFQWGSRGETQELKSPPCEEPVPPSHLSARKAEPEGKELRMGTPIENYKFNSPSPAAVKMTQSIYRDESSLSRLSAHSGTPYSLKEERSSRLEKFSSKKK